MTRPSREQIEAAREHAQRLLDTCGPADYIGREGLNVFRVFLAATTPPAALPTAPSTERDLAEEAAQYACRVTDTHFYADDVEIALRVIRSDRRPHGTWHLLVWGYARRENRPDPERNP